MTAGRSISKRRAGRFLVPVAAVAIVSAGTLALTAAPAAAGSNVGYACAYFSNVSLFGGAYGSMGCGTQTSPYASANSAAPSVTRPPNGAYRGATDSDGAAAVYGPAYIFSSPYDANDNLTNSGQLSVSTQGTSTITAQAQSRAVGPSPFWTKTPTSWQPAADEGYVKATCSATSTNRNGSVEVKNGVVDTSIDVNTGYPASQVTVPNNPPQNHRVDFTIDNVGDHGHMIFNERITNPDGSLTVNGAHMYMEGPIALGEVIIAQVTCGHN